ncbi:hypothetical protein G4B88_001701 [Cannabis sativa]|uniref:Uncharacterized protein n=1 Tax=Cannabis sativa TaxID=3483 RepID=A0A7J6I1Q9_CANSA|nr:hypothetical protein G4B88_001701 [Cannabis sativa]
MSWVSEKSLSSRVMKVKEITEEKHEEESFYVDTECKKERIRKIIEYQKSVYSASSLASSSSSSSSVASSSSLSSSHRTNSLINLMKSGSTSLRRLFELEHTSLATYFEHYSGSPVIKPILLWGSDSDNEGYDPWKSIKQFRPSNDSVIDGLVGITSNLSFEDKEFDSKNRRAKKPKLTRKRSFRRLPRFGFWRCKGFRLRKLRIVFHKKRII